MIEVHNLGLTGQRFGDRERQVLPAAQGAVAGDGRSARGQGSALGVKTHVSRILAKLALRDRVQAVILAYESGITRPSR